MFILNVPYILSCSKNFNSLLVISHIKSCSSSVAVLVTPQAKTKNLALRNVLGLTTTSMDYAVTNPAVEHSFITMTEAIITTTKCLLTWPPGTAQERKGKRKSSPGADSGQTFNTFAGWAMAEIIKYTHKQFTHHWQSNSNICIA